MSEKGDNNVTTIKNQKYAYRIILSGFGVIGGIAVAHVVAPIISAYLGVNVQLETTLSAAAMGYIGGFLAGRKT